MSVNFNSSNFTKSTQNVNTKLNLSQLVLTGPMTSVGISNSQAPIVSSTDIVLNGTAQFSQQVGATTGHVLTCDSTGKGSWQPALGIYNSSTNRTTLQGTTTTAGIDNSTNPINSSQNIVLSGSARVKYPTGNVGQVLTSDATGLLTLGTLVPALTQVNGLLYQGNVLNGNPNTIGAVSVGQMSLTIGTWLIYYRIGMVPSTSISLSGAATFGVSNLSQAVSTDPYASARGAISANTTHQFIPHQFILNVISPTTYFLSLRIGTTTTSVAISTSASTHFWAIRIA
jgi:hypothetical protein